ncbi:MAG: hypothetical protein ABF969_04130 [Sporolactobacillus sp.]
MARGIARRRFGKLRLKYKRDIYLRVKENKAFGMMIIETYTAKQHRVHIMKIWELLGTRFPEASKAYNYELFGKHLSGIDEMGRSLYFSAKDLWDKYNYKLPECLMMGDALAAAYQAMK